MFSRNTRFEKLMDSMFNDINNTWSSTIEKYERIPSIVRDGEETIITLTLPGYERENLEVSIQDDILTVKTLDGTLDADQTEFSRSFAILDEFDTSSCSTQMKAGILKIKFKHKKEDSKKIILK